MPTICTPKNHTFLIRGKATHPSLSCPFPLPSLPFPLPFSCPSLTPFPFPPSPALTVLQLALTFFPFSFTRVCKVPILRLKTHSCPLADSSVRPYLWTRDVVPGSLPEVRSCDLQFSTFPGCFFVLLFLVTVTVRRRKASSIHIYIYYTYMFERCVCVYICIHTHIFWFKFSMKCIISWSRLGLK